jgi:hypothetical protein
VNIAFTVITRVHGIEVEKRFEGEVPANYASYVSEGGDPVVNAFQSLIEAYKASRNTVPEEIHPTIVNS